MAVGAQDQMFAKNGKESDLVSHEKLRVLTLNCWGIPYVSKLKKERFDAIGQELSKGNYDIVSLQEVWDKNDYEVLKVRLEAIFPYSYYFYGGVFGTAICIFSRYPILNTFVYPFPVSGYPYALAHGDWFGGKSACFALIDHPAMNIHFFTSHLHAEYDRVNDIYLAHRTVQAYHLARLINQLTEPEDFVILCGDMNSEPSDPCYRIIKELPQLRDCWADRGQKSGVFGNTCDRSENTFTTEKYKQHQLGGPEDGKRIDYVFYRSLDQKWQCESAAVTMSRVPGESFSFSDHDGVSAVFGMNGKSVAKIESNKESRHRVLSETNGIVKNEIRSIGKHFYKKLFLVAILLLFIFYPVFHTAQPDSLFAPQTVVGKSTYICRILLTMFLCGFSWLIVMYRNYELHVYENVTREIDLQLNHGHYSCRRKPGDTLFCD